MQQKQNQQYNQNGRRLKNIKLIKNGTYAVKILKEVCQQLFDSCKTKFPHLTESNEVEVIQLVQCRHCHLMFTGTQALGGHLSNYHGKKTKKKQQTHQTNKQEQQHEEQGKQLQQELLSLQQGQKEENNQLQATSHKCDDSQNKNNPSELKKQIGINKGLKKRNRKVDDQDYEPESKELKGCRKRSAKVTTQKLAIGPKKRRKNNESDDQWINK